MSVHEIAISHDGQPVNPKEIAGRMKSPMQLVPLHAIESAAKVLGCGAAKYGPWNWRETEIVEATYLGAALRHLERIQSGEDIDPESGESHWSHLAAMSMIVLDAMRFGKIARLNHAPAETSQRSETAAEALPHCVSGAIAAGQAGR